MRIFEVRDLPVDVIGGPNPRRLHEVRGEVRLDAVSFRDPAGAHWALRGVDLLVPPGTTTAVVGARGYRFRGGGRQRLARGGRYARLAGELIT